jgi:hypothetical protein
VTPVRNALDGDESKKIAALRRPLGLVAIGKETSAPMRQESEEAISRLLEADLDREDHCWL